MHLGAIRAGSWRGLASYGVDEKAINLMSHVRGASKTNPMGTQARGMKELRLPSCAGMRTRLYMCRSFRIPSRAHLDLHSLLIFLYIMKSGGVQQYFFLSLLQEIKVIVVVIFASAIECHEYRLAVAV